MIGDRARDEAVAVAKEYSHPAVEPRHVLWGLLRALGDAAPAEVTVLGVRGLLEPVGGSFDSPTVSPDAEALLDQVKSESAAVSVAVDLARQLGLGETQSKSSAAHAAGGRAVADVPDAASGATVAAIAEAEQLEADDVSSEAILAELDALVGLAPVKAAVRRLIAVQRLNAERRAAGLPEVNASKHIVFTGHPAPAKPRSRG